MGAYSAISSNLASSAAAAYTLGEGLQRKIYGDARKVHFIQNRSTVVEFDAVLNESHSQEASPTIFPLESGNSITDHVIVTPFELSITGIVTDSPTTGDPKKVTNIFAQEEVTTAANLLAGPLGVLGAAAYTKFGTSSLLAQNGSLSRSTAVFNTLMALISGNQAAYIVPAPFDVVTSLRSYPNMILRSLQVQRDASTGSSLTFAMSLLQLLLVSPQSAVIGVFKNPAVSSHKAKLEDANPERVEDSKYKQGVNARDRLTGVAEQYPEAG